MYEYKIFVMPDVDSEEELTLHSEPTLADAKATVSLYAEMSVKRLLEAGVSDIICLTTLEEADAYEVSLSWIYADCKHPTWHDAQISGRLVMA